MLTLSQKGNIYWTLIICHAPCMHHALFPNARQSLQYLVNTDTLVQSPENWLCNLPNIIEPKNVAAQDWNPVEIYSKATPFFYYMTPISLSWSSNTNLLVLKWSWMLTGWNKVIQPCSNTGKDWHKAKFTTVVSMLCCLSKEENSFYRRGKSGPWKGFDRIEQTAFKHVNEFSAGNVDPFWHSPNFIMVLGWWFTEEGIFMLTRNVDLG